MKFENCDIHDNILIDQAVVLPNGEVIKVNDNDDDNDNHSRNAHKPSARPSGTLSSERTMNHKPKRPARIVLDTFRYKWLDMPDGQMRLIRLYQKLIHESCGWLDPNTSPEDWCALFMGEPKSFTMKWLGTQAHLRYLFKLLLDRGYIECSNKSVGRWEVLGSHFVNSKSKPFTDWDSQKDPKRIEGVISALAEMLNICLVLK